MAVLLVLERHLISLNKWTAVRNRTRHRLSSIQFIKIQLIAHEKIFNTVYNVAKLNVDTNPNMAPLLEKLDAEFIRPGYLGMFSGKGFYNYPNPAYETANFLK